MSNYLINDKFIKKFEELQRAVGVSVSDYKVTKSNHFIDSNSDTIQVRILSVVESPDTGAYAEGSAIQFTGVEVYQNELTNLFESGRYNFDSSITSKQDTADRFDMNNLYGIGIEFDYEAPLDIEDDFVGEVFNATRKSVKLVNDAGENEIISVWSISQSSGKADPVIAHCEVISEVSSSVYSVYVRVGNPNTYVGTPPIGHLHFNYASTNTVAVGAEITTVIYESDTENVAYDCFPIETTMNLIAPPEVTP